MIAPDPDHSTANVVQHSKGVVTYYNMGNCSIMSLDSRHHATLVKGKSIRIWGVDMNVNRGDSRYDPSVMGIPYDHTFEVGDEIEYDSYNLSYIATIVSITDKNVIVAPRGTGKKSRLSPQTVSWRNRLESVQEKRARNSDAMYYL